MTGQFPLILNPAHRPAAYGDVFRQHGRLHIPSILTPDSSQALYQTLASAEDWTRSIHVREGEDLDISVRELEAMPADRRAELEASLVGSSSDSLQYIFDTVRISAETRAGRAMSEPMKAIAHFINSAAFLEFVAQVTGDDRLAFADVMATRYLPGHFLTAHGDENPRERRLYAYVLNMTPVWRADWGGVLMFLDNDGHVAEGYIPAFNALNLFSVPQTHAVSMVTRLAQTPRLSITGWLHAR
ncbi:2OG-Fe(II) oxygenase family protein [Brevundimonas kwangchunensis]|uniref:2OG-Fe(II) oxygenase family protein n=1 Tax=Brevundimonas kwangchunensis TaxID=322163 RepID=A0ABP3S8R5_9CAUL